MERRQLINELTQDILNEFKSKDNTYEHSDRLHVAIHKVVDEQVSGLDTAECFKLLGEYDEDEFKTLDSGLYEGSINEGGFIRFCKVILYCVIEQDLYNDDEVNELQNVKEVNGIKLK